MMEMKLEFDGRKVIKRDVKEFEPGKMVTFIEMDDGTTLNITQTAGEIDVQSNKSFEVLPDGKTVRIID